MPVGSVVLGHDGEYAALSSFPTENGKSELQAPDGGWGMRFDIAADAVWAEYAKNLPWHERAHRWMWRWLGVGWFLFGTVGGVLTSFAVKALT